MINCLVCSSKTHKISFEIMRCVTSDAKIINAPLSHSYCSSCGFVFVDFDKRVNYEEFYTNEYEFLLDGEVEPTLDDGKYSDSLVEFYQEFLENSSDKTFFDIGAGKGNFIQAVENKYNKLQKYALEPSKSYEILKTKNFLKEKYNSFFNSKDFTLKFDYISLIGVLEHVPNPKEFLLDIKSIMNEDSYILIEVPNFENNKSDLLTVDHLSKFTENSILNLFNICGINVIKKRVSNSVPMQFILKKSNDHNSSINSLNNFDYINNAINYLKKIENDISNIENDKIVVYGQGLVLDYLIGINKINIENIVCVIDDNPLYQGKKYKNKINILSFDEFKISNLSNKTKKIFLAMNDCYHHKVNYKLDGFEVIGANI
ncbi:class I SAM-dependent methyltransferase [Aliarcobacter butzleri]|uniref:Class I SAM-dependent methyltransferase n=1 Tax=Aliarcobacter butzleri TaxID=28197 RepID=A0AAW7PP16_9BACT|nr:class I SAM-dependent methyltransferase [Aliarcobacter butzleri]MDN5062714.1 class I SAM-dependent methyltransferase [Aliarcobacter butzleri]MDN5065595.1 class I SAM-dependent methyltransferase [Aliarcobacter butzleri]